MEIDETRIKTIKEQIRIPEEGKESLTIDLTTEIQDGSLKEIEIIPWGKKTISLIPSDLFSEYHWEYLEKLTKFLNEVLKLQKK